MAIGEMVLIVGAGVVTGALMIPSRRRLTRYWRDWSSVIMFSFPSRRRHTRYWRDWSSDVCSSDLRPSPALLKPMFAALLAGNVELKPEWDALVPVDAGPQGLQLARRIAKRLPEARRGRGIGRGAGRGRGEISVVAGSFKKKKMR